MFQSEIKIETEKYDICVNPAIECLGVLFVLSDFGLNKVRSNAKYLENISKEFAKFKEHKAVKGLKELVKNQYFRYNGPVELFLHIYNNLPIRDDFCKMFGLDKKAVNHFIKDLQDFIKISGFEAFFNKNNEYYLSKMRKFAEDMSIFSPVEYLVNFLNMPAKKLNVLLMFGVSSANYGVEVAGKPYCCARPYKLSRDDDVDFSYDKPYITTLLLHEFAHTFINPLTSKYESMVKLIDKDKFALCFEVNRYGDDVATVINENIIRAIECIYLYETDKAAYSQYLKDYKQDGFICIEGLMKLYKTYINENKYQNFAEFYDKVLVNYFISNYGKV